MKKYIAVFLGSATGEAMKKWMSLEEEARKKRESDGLAAWKSWVETHSKSILDLGGPLGKTKTIDAGGISDIKNLLTGYSIIEAESHEAAAKMFLNHPHFTIFPGDSIEIMECLAIPN
jgi:hypothetical protein